MLMLNGMLSLKATASNVTSRHATGDWWTVTSWST